MSEINNRIEEAVRFLSLCMPDSSKLVKPTLFHSIRVGVSLYNYGYSEDIVIAGFLHDLVEDADITIEEIEGKFGIEVARLVEAETKDSSIQDEIEKADNLISKLLKFGEDALIIKAADLIDNLVEYKKRSDDKALNKLIRMSVNLLNNKPKLLIGRLFNDLAREVNF